MKFKVLFEQENKIKVEVSDKGKFYNYVYGWGKKEIKRGKGYPILLNIQFPLGLNFFWKGDVYEEFTGRIVMEDQKIENLESQFNQSKFLKSLSNKSIWKNWYDNLKELNKKELGVVGNIQNLKIKNKPTTSQQYLMDFKEKIFKEFKNELNKRGYVISQKEENFNLQNGKKVKGYLITSKKFEYDYFIKMKYDSIRKQVEIDFYEKSTGMRANSFHDIYSFVNDIDRMIKMEKTLDLSKFKKVN